MTKILVIVLIGVILILVPLGVIWAVNTLFSLMIPFTFKTYIASLILSGLITSGNSSK